MTRQPGLQLGAIAEGNLMAHAAPPIEQRQPVEAVIERADPLQGPDPADLLDGGGSGSIDTFPDPGDICFIQRLSWHQ
jgi:hypothetical protein